jgi:hypothetical protein
MQQKFKAHRLFTNGQEIIPLINKLNVSSEEEEFLVKCRTDVRTYLKAGFTQLRSSVAEKFSEFDDDIRKLKPKFWTQGSFAYKTMNNPATNPPQQIDLDDGVYFPMTLLDGKPVAVKNKLLKIVKLMLTELANQKGWTVSEKPTCLRLGVNKRVHIDVPVYAIPETKYEMLKASMEAHSELRETADSSTILLDPEEVHLARWDSDDWIKSDPKELHDWFMSKTKIHGKQFLRRICRYMKAWRDVQWIKGGPSSITLMVAVAKVFDDNLMNNKKEFGSDCEALLAVAKELPRIFNSEIRNPIADDEIMFPRGLDQIEIKEIREKVASFSEAIIQALCVSQNEDEVVETLASAFGLRLPKRPDWVERYTVGDVVRSAPHITTQASTSFKEEHRSG